MAGGRQIATKWRRLCSNEGIEGGGGKPKRGNDANVRHEQSYYSVNPYAHTGEFIGRSTNFACQAKWSRDKDGKLATMETAAAGGARAKGGTVKRNEK